ncbi:MAG TPA: hypothetical protein VGI84_06745 [Pseudonocardiaceae bacterium]|jgi:hypothetical protein
MADSNSIYLMVLATGVVLTVVVGQILVRSGRPFLEDVFDRPETVASVTRLLVVLFYLVVLGVIALVATIDVTFNNPVETMVVRLGFVLLVLGVVYAGTLLVLARLRKRRHEQMLLDEMNAQAEQARRARPQPFDAQGVGAPRAHTNPTAGQTYPGRAAYEGQPQSGQQPTGEYPAIEPGSQGR